MSANELVSDFINADFLFIQDVMIQLFLVTLTLFFITKPVDKKVNIIIFTKLAPTPIQSGSRNVHYKNEASDQHQHQITETNYWYFEQPVINCN